VPWESDSPVLHSPARARTCDPWNMFGHVFASQALTSALVYAGSDAGVLQARDLLDFEEGPGNKLRDTNGDPLDLGAKIGSSPAVCYTPDGSTWRRWIFVTARDGGLHAFSSRL